MAAASGMDWPKRPLLVWEGRPGWKVRRGKPSAITKRENFVKYNRY